jgi:transglutaminase-like putative cysteine protease
VRFEIEYTSVYSYPAEVWDNLNTLRVKPVASANQRVEGFELRLSPDAPVAERRDYFGTHVLEFGVHERHSELRIEATCRVTTDAESLPAATGWGEIADPSYRAAGGEFLLQAGTAPANGQMRELTDAVKADSPLGTALMVAELIPERFTYQPGVTFVGSTVADLLEAGAGVCQDFVHLALRLLREHGIAARYVSGYLFAAGEGGGRDSVEVQTHAWVEALMPTTGDARVLRGEAEEQPVPRWIELDPTNSKVADETHVKIGHGRFYQDVPPIRGVYKGAASSDLEARVGMHRRDD